MTTSIPGTLGRFQDAFARALIAPGVEPDPEVRALTAQPAFAVYRNTVMKGCVDALLANFPAVARLVGEAWFRAAAAVYARDNLPKDPTLPRYGATFPDFLARFEPAMELPYLAGVSRLDRFWTESHTAAPREALDPGTVARLAPGALAGAVLLPHPATRWAWFPDLPIYTIWSRNRANSDHDARVDWQSEGALLARPRDAVEWIALDAAGCAFLDACAAGNTLAAAAQSALVVHPGADLARLMSTLLGAGAFSRT